MSITGANVGNYNNNDIIIGVTTSYSTNADDK